MTTGTVQPFKIAVDSQTLEWVSQRVKTARIIPDIDHPKGKEWDDGIPSATVEELVTYWNDEYDWRKIEERLNVTYKMFTVPLDDGDETIDLHFVHHRSDRGDAIPLLFVHGWPGNFTEVESLLSLASPSDPNHQAYHIVAPSLPGFVFSSAPKAPGFTINRIAAICHKLMITLGYDHFIGQGGDWGSFVLRAIALQYPESCVGIHLNYILGSPPSPFKNPITLLWLMLRWFTDDEKKRLARLQWWMKSESGYSRIQGTKPQTVSFGLLDSPVGMLAWIREKLESLVEPGYTWKKETVVTWTMLYLLSNNAGHARIYKEGINTVKGEVLDKTISSKVAFGASCFPKDVGFIPQWWAKAVIAENIVFWKVHEKGGHFPSVECGDVLIQDIVDFTAAIHGERREALVKAGRPKL